MNHSKHPNSLVEASTPVDAADMEWKSTRERAREIIRAEVEKLDPAEDARRPLELIVESSVRYTQSGEGIAFTVLDQNGQPRTNVMESGLVAPFTLLDLLTEIRHSHPTMFKTAPAPVEKGPHAPLKAHEPHASADEDAKPQRDWLDLGAGKPARAGLGLLPLGERALVRLRDGKAKISSWSEGALRPWRDHPTEAAEAPAASSMPQGAGPRPLPPAPLSSRGATQGRRYGRRGLAAGAAALAAILAIGLFAFSGEDRAAEDNEPTVTGAVSAPPASASATPASSPATPPASPAAQPKAQTLRGVPEVIDTATLSIQGQVVRLFGVEWSSGAGKPDDLARYLQGREVTCEATGTSDSYRCQVGEQDLSRVVLFNGGGRATAEATPELKAAAETARSAQIGVWSK